MSYTPYLKVRKRFNDGNEFFVRSHLNYWLGLFSSTSPLVYSEDWDLPCAYSSLNVIAKEYLESLDEYRNWCSLVRHSCINPSWHKAAYALGAPYFLPDSLTGKYIINIDADDILLTGFNTNYIDQLIGYMEANPSDFMLSYDMHLSHSDYKQIPHIGLLV